VIPWAIVDTGVLIALLDRNETHHLWAKEQFQKLKNPMLTCEAVITEASYLLEKVPLAKDGLFGMLQVEAISVAFNLSDHISEVRALLAKYQDVPMSLADACLVRMAELNERHLIFTLDSDFRVYRKNGRETLRLITPV